VTAVRCDARSTRAAYARGAAVYDRVWSPVIRPPAVRVVRELRIAGARRVLDVGAGTGALSSELARAAPDATIVSIDAAPEMLRYAVRHRAATATVADAMRLPIRSDDVDAVLLAYVLFMLPDPDAGLREARRVLRDGGRVGTVTWAGERPTRAAEVWEQTLEALDVPTLPAHSNHSGLETADAVAARLEAAGLAPRRVWYEHIEHTIAPGDFFELRTGHGTPGARLAALGAPERRHALEELRARLAALTPGDYTVRGSLVCAVAGT